MIYWHSGGRQIAHLPGRRVPGFLALSAELRECTYLSELKFRKAFRNLSERCPGLTEKEVEQVYPAQLMEALLPTFVAADRVLVKAKEQTEKAKQVHAQLLRLLERN